MKNVVLSLLLGIVACFAAVIPGKSQPADRSVAEGTWRGLMGMPGGEHFGFSLKVEFREEGPFGILSPDPVPSERFELTSFKVTDADVTFQWHPMSSPITCVLEGDEDGVYSGSCVESDGGAGPAVLAPPGIEITKARLRWNGSRTEIDKRQTRERLDDIDGPRGAEIEVDGHGVYALVEGDGEPTVVFLSDLGDGLRTWDYVHHEVQQFTRALAYSRSGIGYSDRSPHERTTEAVAGELHVLLENSETPPPYVLVGHGLGAVFARAFAEECGTAVAGLVLIDPVHELEGRRLSELDESSWATHRRRQETLYNLAPEPIAAEFALYREIVDAGRIEGVGGLPDVPTVVLTSIKTSGKDGWIGETAAGLEAARALHEQMIDSLSWKRHMITEESGSYIHREDPDMVVNAIREVLQVIKQGSSNRAQEARARPTRRARLRCR